MNKTVLDLSASEMREFFLQSDSYCTVKLPKYFCFTKLLKNLYEHVKKTEPNLLPNCQKAGKYEHINYEITVDKSRGLDWRKLQLIHPFLYVCLLRVMENRWDEIKKRFVEFKTDIIVPIGIPICPCDNENYRKATVLNWWEKVENFSISLSLEYSCLAITDITDCYNSVYTHAVTWALHEKKL